MRREDSRGTTFFRIDVVTGQYKRRVFKVYKYQQNMGGFVTVTSAPVDLGPYVAKALLNGGSAVPMSISLAGTNGSVRQQPLGTWGGNKLVGTVQRLWLELREAMLRLSPGAFP